MQHPTGLRFDQDRLLDYLEALRGSLIRIGAVVFLFSIGGYLAAHPVLLYLKGLTGVTLVAFGIPETFFAFLKIALVIGLAASMPYALYRILRELKNVFPAFSRCALLGFWIGSVILFGLGVVFCLKILLPYGARFLLSFQGPEISACISVGKFVSFCALFIIGLGMVFELPLVMVLLACIGAVDAQTLARYRHYALLLIIIAAAVLTPTPDLVNLTLVAVPLYLLFEMGLLGMRLCKRRRGPATR